MNARSYAFAVTSLVILCSSHAQSIPGYTIETVAGTGDLGFSGDGGLATQAAINKLTSLAVCSDGTLYIADFSNHAIRKVDPSGVITTLVGRGEVGFSPDGTLATEAFLNEATGVAVDGEGVVYFSDSINHRIRKLTPIPSR